MRSPQLHHLVVLILAGGCLSDTISYSPQEDDEAINSIVHVFSAPGAGGLTLSLCEDIAAVEDTNKCQVEHTVRGGGRGRRHEESHGGGGCGGCPSATVAVVTGTVSGGSLATPRLVKGEILLGRGINGDDPYGFPYDVTLSCEGMPTPCSLRGTLEDDGTLQVTFTDNVIAGAGSTEHAMTSVGEASCP